MAQRGRGTKSTEGRRVLRLLLKDMSQTAIATRIGAEQQYVSSWARGLSRPEPHFRDALMREFASAGFTADCWYTDREHAIAHGGESSGALPSSDDSDPHRAAS